MKGQKFVHHDEIFPKNCNMLLIYGIISYIYLMWEFGLFSPYFERIEFDA